MLVKQRKTESLTFSWPPPILLLFFNFHTKMSIFCRLQCNLKISRAKQFVFLELNNFPSYFIIYFAWMTNRSRNNANIFYEYLLLNYFYIQSMSFYMKSYISLKNKNLKLTSKKFLNFNMALLHPIYLIKYVSLILKKIICMTNYN